MVASWFLSETGPAAILLAALGLSEMRPNLIEHCEWLQKSVVNIICTILKPNGIPSQLGTHCVSTPFIKETQYESSSFKSLIQETVETAGDPDGLLKDEDDVPVQVNLLHPAQVDRLPLLILARQRSPQDSSLLAPVK